MARVKAEGFTTREEFDQAVDRIARLEIERRKFEATRDKQIQDIQAEHNDDIQQRKQEIEALIARAEAYAKDHRDELLPKGKQSSDTTLANFGFRWGQKALALLSNRWSWDSVIASLKAAGLEVFIRVKTEVDKDAVKDQLAEGVLAQHGMRIKQSETFWVEPKTDLI